MNAGPHPACCLADADPAADSASDLAHAVVPGMPPPRTRRVQIFYEPDYEGVGPRLIVLAGSRWPAYLRRYCGINTQPLFERDSLAHEPDVFPNGHPFAWAYRSATELLADEARWLPPEVLSELAAAIDRAAGASTSASPSSTKATRDAAAPAQALAVEVSPSAGAAGVEQRTQ